MSEPLTYEQTLALYSAVTIRELAQAGLTAQEIADRLGQPLSEIRTHPDMMGVVGPAHDERVEQALYERAVGTVVLTEKATKEGPVLVREAIPPDPKAAMAWLQTRRPERWAQAQRAPLEVVVVRIEGEKPTSRLTLDADVTDAD